jgi:two-component system chemotaxis sensor kinase CheA
MDPLRYRDLFLSESREHLGKAYELLGRWESRPHEAAAPAGLLRHAHSLKGMAATMGYPSMVRLAHAIEDFSERMRGELGDATEIPFFMLGAALTHLGRIIDGVERGDGDAEDGGVDDLAAALLDWIPEHGNRGIAADRAQRARVSAPLSECVGADQPACARWCIELQVSRASEGSAEQTVRTLERLRGVGRIVHVSPPLLSGEPPRFDGRLSLVLEFSDSRSVLETRLREIPELSGFEVRADDRAPDGEEASVAPRQWMRVRADLLDAVVELVLEVMLEQGRARQTADGQSGRLRHHLERSEFLLKTLYARVRELRLVPFRTLTQRLNHAVYELAESLGKRVRFGIEGGEVELDRSTLDALLDPLLHLLRNALDHGVESPAQRSRAGKPPTARLLLGLARHGDRVVISLDDDGRGMQATALREAAIERGLLSRQAAAALSDGEALLLATRPGFSTARELTPISGRGVGLDVVRRDVEKLGGRLRIESQPTRGTRFELELPMNLALIPAVLVRCAGDLYALPVREVQETLELESVRGNSARSREARQELELRRLDERLHAVAALEEADRPGSVLVLAGGDRPRGLIVDEVLGQRQVVVRPLREPLTGLHPYSGAALLEDGSIALVIDAAQL